jgi:hypothetical protein
MAWLEAAPPKRLQSQSSVRPEGAPFSKSIASEVTPKDCAFANMQKVPSAVEVGVYFPFTSVLAAPRLSYLS